MQRFLIQRATGSSACTSFLQKQKRPFASVTRAMEKSNAQKVDPFHLAIPVHNLQMGKYYDTKLHKYLLLIVNRILVIIFLSKPHTARDFYGFILGFEEGRSSKTWQDYNMLGHQLVVHEVSPDYRGQDYHNPVGQAIFECLALVKRALGTDFWCCICLFRHG